MCEREKMLVTSIFSFSHNFLSNGFLVKFETNQGLFGEGLGFNSGSDGILWQEYYSCQLETKKAFQTQYRID